MMIQSTRDLIAAVNIHARKAGCQSVAHRWDCLTGFQKSDRVCQRDIAQLKRQGSPDDHLAAAAIDELVTRRIERRVKLASAKFLVEPAVPFCSAAGYAGSRYRVFEPGCQVTANTKAELLTRIKKALGV